MDRDLKSTLLFHLVNLVFVNNYTVLEYSVVHEFLGLENLILGYGVTRGSSYKF
jgi:hypothetical protein